MRQLTYQKCCWCVQKDFDCRKLLIRDRSGPWVLGGDFNVIRFSDERKGGDNNVRDMNHFNDLVANLQLVEIPLTERRFTWTSMIENPSLVRLDRVFVPTD